MPEYAGGGKTQKVNNQIKKKLMAIMEEKRTGEDMNEDWRVSGR